MKAEHNNNIARINYANKGDFIHNSKEWNPTIAMLTRLRSNILNESAMGLMEN